MGQEELKRMGRLVFKIGLGSKLYQLDLKALVRNIFIYIIYIYMYIDIPCTYVDFYFLCTTFGQICPPTFWTKILKEIWPSVKRSSHYIIFLTTLHFLLNMSPLHFICYPGTISSKVDWHITQFFSSNYSKSWEW